MMTMMTDAESVTLITLSTFRVMYLRWLSRSRLHWSVHKFDMWRVRTSLSTQVLRGVTVGCLL